MLAQKHASLNPSHASLNPSHSSLNPSHDCLKSSASGKGCEAQLSGLDWICTATAWNSSRARPNCTHVNNQQQLQQQLQRNQHHQQLLVDATISRCILSGCNLGSRASSSSNSSGRCTCTCCTCQLHCNARLCSAACRSTTLALCCPAVHPQVHPLIPTPGCLAHWLTCCCRLSIATCLCRCCVCLCCMRQRRSMSASRHPF